VEQNVGVYKKQLRRLKSPDYLDTLHRVGLVSKRAINNFIIITTYDLDMLTYGA
jgi:hypothetical protein